jgi:hypothetical protein
LAVPPRALPGEVVRSASGGQDLGGGPLVGVDGLRQLRCAVPPVAVHAALVQNPKFSRPITRGFCSARARLARWMAAMFSSVVWPVPRPGGQPPRQAMRHRGPGRPKG